MKSEITLNDHKVVMIDILGKLRLYECSEEIGKWENRELFEKMAVLAAQELGWVKDKRNKCGFRKVN